MAVVTVLKFHTSTPNLPSVASQGLILRRSLPERAERNMQNLRTKTHTSFTLV